MTQNKTDEQKARAHFQAQQVYANHMLTHTHPFILQYFALSFQQY